MKSPALALALLCAATAAFAQTSPGWVSLSANPNATVVLAPQVNAFLATKMDTAKGTCDTCSLANPAITGGSINGAAISGSYSGQADNLTVSGNSLSATLNGLAKDVPNGVPSLTSASKIQVTELPDAGTLTYGNATLGSYLAALNAGSLNISNGSFSGAVSIGGALTGATASFTGTLSAAGSLTVPSIIETTTATPLLATSACATGQHYWDSSYDYRCVSPNHWNRTPSALWSTPPYVFLGGIDGFTDLATASNTTHYRATGKGGVYLHQTAVSALSNSQLQAIAAGMAGSGTGEVEFGLVSAANALGWFNPGGWVTQFLNNNGFYPTTANVNADFTSPTFLVDWMAYVDAAKANGWTTLAPVFSPNTGYTSGNWTDPAYASIRSAALYGGALAIDAPPAFFSGQSGAYQAFAGQEIKWAHANGLRVTVIISPYGDDPTFLTDTQGFVSSLTAAKAVATEWVVENYNTDVAGTIGADTATNSMAGVATWVANNAPVYTSTPIDSYGALYESATPAGQNLVNTAPIIAQNGISLNKGALTVAGSSLFPLTTQSGAYTLAAGDCGTTIRETSATAVTITVPSGLSLGCQVKLIQAGAGAVTVAPGAGMSAEMLSGASATMQRNASAMIQADSTSTYLLGTVSASSVTDATNLPVTVNGTQTAVGAALSAAMTTASAGPLATQSGSNASTAIANALGYVPYSAANPGHYIAASQAPVTSVNGQTGAVTLPTSASYTLPQATSATLGGVTVGTGLNVSNGSLSANVVSVGGATGSITARQLAGYMTGQDLSTAYMASGAVTGQTIRNSQVSDEGELSTLYNVANTAVQPNTSAGQENITVVPTGNAVRTLTTQNVQASAASATGREFMVNLGFSSSTGGSTPGADKAVIYGGMQCYGGSGNCWASNFLVNANSGFTGSAFGGEFDANNSGSDAPAYTSRQVTALAANGTISGSNNYMTAGLGIGSVNSVPIFHDGVMIVNNAVRDASIYDTGNSTYSYRNTGSHPQSFVYDTGTSPEGINLAGHYSVTAMDMSSSTSPNAIVIAPNQKICFSNGGACARYRSSDDTWVFSNAGGTPIMSINYAGNLTITGSITQNGAVSP